jgi:hypothetical protein
LIGKELSQLKNLLVNEKIKLIISNQLINEREVVTSRERLARYFDKKKVADLISLLKIISEKFEVDSIKPFCRDPKDDFLLALSKKSKADYLITGDNDLLALNTYGRTEILSIKKFSEKIDLLLL